MCIQDFKICKLANWWHQTKKKDNLVSQFLSEKFDYLQEDSTKCAPQYELSSFVTMPRHWVSDLPNIKSFSSHLWHSILRFANIALYAWSSKHINMFATSLWPRLMFLGLKITKILKSSGYGLVKSELPLEQIFFRCASLRTVSLPKFSGLWCKLAKIALLIYFI